MTENIRSHLASVLEGLIPAGISAKKGRKGMTLWQIFVMGTLRVNLNWDYDRLQEMVNGHKTIRQMLGHESWGDNTEYSLQRLKDLQGTAQDRDSLTVGVLREDLESLRREIATGVQVLVQHLEQIPVDLRQLLRLLPPFLESCLLAGVFDLFHFLHMVAAPWMTSTGSLTWSAKKVGESWM